MKPLARWITRALLPLCVVSHAMAQDEPARKVSHGAELYLGGGLAADELQLPARRGIALSDDQRDRLFEILAAQELAMHRQARVVEKAQEEMRRLAVSSDYSEAEARALSEVIARATAEITYQLNRSDRQIFEMLTPQQREQATAAFRLTAAATPAENMPTLWRN